MTMIPIKEQFVEAENAWDLERLYTDLAEAKGRTLSPTEKLYLRGLLSGHSPAEIAEKCHKSAGGVKVYLSSTVYQYVKMLANKENEKLENWTNIRKWLEGIGYKRSSLYGKNVFNLTCNHSTQSTQCQKIDNWNVNSPSTREIESKHELEKANLMIEQRNKENELLRQQVSDLREIIGLLKKAEKPE
ncbi:helix-turn-helix transcriptional regulator [Candidatus Marithrix sp. Canyon 246]|uniref:helix-turn-helix transcriptional regulator n=1 Tax=Candidatus Marithrix sp. Canyon 246 TaxID=1827136 RepID=UPI000849F781|nr:LuxR C-terminal-related transcriptional regulator [Candidatus Marithrix sp. Canyon 246]